MTVDEVMARHGRAIAAADVDGVLADYSEDSVIMSPDRTARGLSEFESCSLIC